MFQYLDQQRIGMAGHEARLSPRAVSFLERVSKPVAAGTGQDVQVNVEDLGDAVDAEKLELLVARLDEVNRVYGGLELPVVEGALAGRLRLGAVGSLRAWRAEGGECVLRVARHSDLQCALTLSSSGRFGSSWGFDFWPLFDSVEQVIENCAMWSSLRGWHFAAVLTCRPQRALANMSDTPPELDAAASGSLAQWWRSHACAVSAERFLNPGRGDVPQVSVLTRTRAFALEIRSRLEESESDLAGGIAAEQRGVVGGQ